jgi:hypothetical protein
MTANTTLARGYQLGRDYNLDGWMGYVNNGEYTDEQQAAIVEALMDAQEAEVDAKLPENCFWFPRLSEIQGPVGSELDINLDDLMEQSSQAVADRYEEIEAKALASLA